MAISIQTLTNNLSFSMSLNSLFPKSSVSAAKPPPSLIVRMGGGPRTFPGGVSKWQWKRMQAKKSKQLLKARLARERQIYEMRKRAELRAATSELERPWEAVSTVAVAPTLLSVPADEQLKVLADRFQRPGGFDMWTARDGPQLFPFPDELPSARFFPKGVVHSIKPYRRELPENSGDVGGDDPRKHRRNSVSNSETGSEDLAISYSKRNLRNGDKNQSNQGTGSPGSDDQIQRRNQRHSAWNPENNSDESAISYSERNSGNEYQNRLKNQRNSKTGSVEFAISDSKRNSGNDDQIMRKNQRNSAWNLETSPEESAISYSKRNSGNWRVNQRNRETGSMGSVSSDFKQDYSNDDQNMRKNQRNLPLNRIGNRLEPFKNPSKLNGGRSGEARPRNERLLDSKRSNSLERKSDRSEFRTKWSRNSRNRDNGFKRRNDSRSEVYHMSLERDGSYGFP